MADFIDISETINAVGLTTDAINFNPTKYVDAQGNELVAVVRCKDCFWFTPYTHTSRPIGECNCDITVRSAYNEVPILEVPLDGYCSRGKRREDE